MYKVEDIKIIPYVRFQTPDGALHDTMDKALAHRPPYCKPGEYVMWGCSEGGYSHTNEYCEAVLMFISTNEAASDFEEACEFFEASSDGVAGPGWYAWDYSERTWMCLPDHIGENLVRE
jgi:hypothetical protein